MTDIAPRVADSEADVPLDPTVREQLSRLRRPLLVVVLVLVAALLVAALKAQSARGYLDPDSAAPSGARAARVLLTEQGVAVTATRTTAAAVAAAGCTQANAQEKGKKPAADAGASADSSGGGVKGW